jgi:hypothetical protein
MAKSQRTTFAKLQRERERQRKQAEKREKRLNKGNEDFPRPVEPVGGGAVGGSELPPGIGRYPEEIGRYPDEIEQANEAPSAG